MDDLLIDGGVVIHPFRETELCALMRIEETRSHGDKPVISIVGTDGSEDRHGSVLNPEGWEMEDYLRNPVVLWSHKQDIPTIGNTINLSRVKSRWTFDVEFAIDEWDDYGGGNLARLVWRLMDANRLRASSVSFIPKKWDDREAQTIPAFFAENLEYRKQELTELSMVNIPSNRNALKKAVSEGVISENEADLLGLGAMFRMAVPIEVRSETRESDDSTDNSADIARLNKVAKAFAEIASVSIEGWTDADSDRASDIYGRLAVMGIEWHDWLRNVLRYSYDSEIERAAFSIPEEIRKMVMERSALTIPIGTTELSADPDRFEDLYGSFERLAEQFLHLSKNLTELTRNSEPEDHELTEITSEMIERILNESTSAPEGGLGAGERTPAERDPAPQPDDDDYWRSLLQET